MMEVSPGYNQASASRSSSLDSGSFGRPDMPPDPKLIISPNLALAVEYEERTRAGTLDDSVMKLGGLSLTGTDISFSSRSIDEWAPSAPAPQKSTEDRKAGGSFAAVKQGGEARFASKLASICLDAFRVPSLECSFIQSLYQSDAPPFIFDAT